VVSTFPCRVVAGDQLCSQQESKAGPEVAKRRGANQAERVTGVADEDTDEFVVVVNDEEQYSLLPVWQDVPDGWRTVGSAASQGECLDHIELIWTDMRPLSLRRAMGDL
jgi:MbtH protein